MLPNDLAYLGDSDGILSTGFFRAPSVKSQCSMHFDCERGKCQPRGNGEPRHTYSINFEGSPGTSARTRGGWQPDDLGAALPGVRERIYIDSEETPSSRSDEGEGQETSGMP
jgi:hypothetical protein